MATMALLLLLPAWEKYEVRNPKLLKKKKLHEQSVAPLIGKPKVC